MMNSIKTIKRVTCIILCVSIIVAVCGVTSMTATAAEISVGMDIDTWIDVYMSEVEKGGDIALSLSTDSRYTNGGKSVRFDFTGYGNAIFSNNTYWNAPVAIAGYTGIRFWMYNTSASEIRTVLRFNNDVEYSLNRDARYFLTDENETVTAERTTYTDTSGWYRYGLGEICLPAGFKGFVFVPFTSIMNLPPDGLGIFKFDFFSSESGTQTAYFDDFRLCEEMPEVNCISEFDEIPETYDNNNTNAELTDDAFNGRGLKLSAQSGTSGMYCTVGNTGIYTSDYQGARFWIKNGCTDVKIAFSSGNMSMLNGSEYYTVDLKTGEKSTCTTTKTMLPNSWGQYLSEISLKAGFEGLVYLPFAGIKNQDGSRDAEFGFCLRIDYSFSGSGGYFILDNAAGYESYCGTNGNVCVQSFDSYPQVYLNEVMELGGNLQISTAADASAPGQSLKFEFEGSADNYYAWFANPYWIQYNENISGCDGLSFRFKNPGDSDILVSYRAFYDLNVSCRNNAAYTLVYSNSVREKRITSNSIFNEPRVAEICIPAGFDGHVEIPFSSFYVSPDKMGAFMIAFRSVNRSPAVIYMDDYELTTASELQLPTVFSDGALLQQNKSVNIWGYDIPGMPVEVSLFRNGECLERASGVTDASGKWTAVLSARAGGYDKYNLTVTDLSGRTAYISDILFGELWLASGQSNMELTVETDMYSENLLADAGNDNIRIFLQPGAPTAGPGSIQPYAVTSDIPSANWGHGNNSADVLRASSVAYQYAKKLQAHLNVPVGIISASVGGSCIEAWIGRQAVIDSSDVCDALKSYGLFLDAYERQTSFGLSSLYNQKIGPLAGLNIAGVIWYQGESNSNRSGIYDIELDLLKKSWSDIFGFTGGTMPFIYTQVAPDCYDDGNNYPFHLGRIAEKMTDALRMNSENNTAMITLYDLPLEHIKNGTSSASIHPRIKEPVAQRFFESAVRLTYGGEGEPSAPIYKSMEIKGDAVYITFEHSGSGLSVNGKTLHGFTVAGSDGVHVNASAVITSPDTVMVWNNRLKSPKSVTYAFSNMNQASNLVNSSGIPAAPFRTDRTGSAEYLAPQEWMTADSDAWEYVAGNNNGYRASWKLSDNSAAYSYDANKKTEGEASLKISGSGESVAVIPEINVYNGRQINLGCYKTVSVDVCGGTGAVLRLSVKTGDGRTYYCAVNGTQETGISITPDFKTAVFELTSVYTADGTPVQNSGSLLNYAKIEFVLNGLNGQPAYLDNITLGMTDKSTVWGDLDNSAHIGARDLMLMQKLLLGIPGGEAAKADINRDLRFDIMDLVRLKKHLAGIIQINK